MPFPLKRGENIYSINSAWIGSMDSRMRLLRLNLSTLLISGTTLNKLANLFKL